MDDKIKYEMEFPIHVSPSLLFQYISTPSGMSEWYADNVNSRGEFFTFIWEGSEERAKLLGKKNNERIKFRWEDDDDTDYYFELRIQVDEITKDVSLMVTDFADEDEIEEGKMLWDNMISNLKHVLGST
ncbi:MAG: SRPBCC domain-containing protein [Flavobacteriaceae bacterium]|nr:SRPBCC domain-containing protein [Flavobacteriaceae bacterium]